ncbi:hypothetical protein ES332_A11G331500v1 [Gossypium tomentosum]|uniref:Uncharacterized protein n=1 Tax=Gossypium tomentosum TaxID=34277 RepID=A0A5D2NI63_GOSTO|nr:hypothetical protein ES332_A11G331500v1 [Gossypium tomentosum]
MGRASVRAQNALTPRGGGRLLYLLISVLRKAIEFNDYISFIKAIQLSCKRGFHTCQAWASIQYPTKGQQTVSNASSSHESQQIRKDESFFA